VDVSAGRYKELYSDRTVKVEVGKLRISLAPGKGAIINLKESRSTEVQTKEG